MDACTMCLLAQINRHESGGFFAPLLMLLIVVVTLAGYWLVT